MGIADRLFDYDEEGDCPKDKTAEGDMRSLLQSAAVPFNRIGWDSYDMSLEIHDVPPEWRMPADFSRPYSKVGAPDMVIRARRLSSAGARDLKAAPSAHSSRVAPDGGRTGARALH